MSGNAAGRAGMVRKNWETWARKLVIIAVCAGAAAAVYSLRSTIGQGIHNVRDLQWAWVAAASVTEVLSMLALALLYRVLLQASRARLTVTWILASSYTVNAISIAVPVIGAGMASREAYKQFREGGADPGAASLSLTLAGIASTVTLAPIVTAAAVLSGNRAASVTGSVAAVAMVIAACAVAMELHAVRGRARLLRLIAAGLRCAQRVVHRPRGDARVVAQSVLTSVQRLQLGASVLGQALLWGLVNWLADVGCLVFAMRATGIHDLSVGKILLVWTAGTGAASLSPTPAGIGAVEVAMAAALTAAGVRGSHAITAILVYRAISLKGAATVWALLYRFVYRRRQRARA